MISRAHEGSSSSTGRARSVSVAGGSTIATAHAARRALAAPPPGRDRGGQGIQPPVRAPRVAEPAHLTTCRVIPFDLDGALVDSTEAFRRHWLTWAAGYGLDGESTLSSGAVTSGIRPLAEPHPRAARSPLPAPSRARPAFAMGDLSRVPPAC